MTNQKAPNAARSTTTTMGTTIAGIRVLWCEFELLWEVAVWLAALAAVEFELPAELDEPGLCTEEVAVKEAN